MNTCDTSHTHLSVRITRIFVYLQYLQNKSKRPETKSRVGTEVVEENVFAPDTGQSLAEETVDRPEELQGAASSSSATSSSNNYNLVTSLLNLTKSPVSYSQRTLM